MTIVLILRVAIAGDRHVQRDPQPGRLILRVVSVLGAVALLAAILVGAPLLAIIAVVVLFAPWLLHLIKWLPDEVRGTGQLLDYILSPKRREPFRMDQAARDAQAIRGAALEKSLRGTRDAWSRSTGTPGPEDGPPLSRT